MDDAAAVQGKAEAPRQRARRWPSLLQPGGKPTPLSERDWFLLAGLYLLALALRWDLRDAQPYLAESWHYFAAVHLWERGSNVAVVGGGVLDLAWFFWQRPLLSLPFHPFALHSFEAYRAAHIVAVASVPPLGAWLLRSLGTGRAATAAAGVVLAVHPLLLPWGVMVLPDSLVLALVLGALLAAHHGRPVAMAALLLAATWVKEVALVTVLALLVLALWRDADGRGMAGRSPRRLRLGPFARWLLPVAALALVPLSISLQMPGALFPGFRAGGSTAEALERLFLLVWLVPLCLLALLRRSTRRFALVALAWPAFFLLYHLLLDKAMEFWYYVLPASFACLAAAAGIDAVRRALPAAGVARAAAVGVALLAFGLVWVQVDVPHEDPVNRAVTTPLTGTGQWELSYLQSFERVRDAGLAEVLAIPGPDERTIWIAMDFEVSYLYHPLAQQADSVVAIHSVPHAFGPELMAQWRHAIENETDVLVIAENDAMADNLALRRAYAECSERSWPFTVVRASQCQGAGEDLWEHYVAAHRSLDGPTPADALAE